MAVVTDYLPGTARVSAVYNDSRGMIDTDVGMVTQTYWHNQKTGDRRPHAICRHTGRSHHPDAALAGARSVYVYVCRSDGRYEGAWYSNHTCLMASKGDSVAIATMSRLYPQDLHDSEGRTA